MLACVIFHHMFSFYPFYIHITIKLFIFTCEVHPKLDFLFEKNEKIGMLVGKAIHATTNAICIDFFPC